MIVRYEANGDLRVYPETPVERDLMKQYLRNPTACFVDSIEDDEDDDRPCLIFMPDRDPERRFTLEQDNEGELICVHDRKTHATVCDALDENWAKCICQVLNRYPNV
jgi:hypothetical protein